RIETDRDPLTRHGVPGDVRVSGWIDLDQDPLVVGLGRVVPTRRAADRSHHRIEANWHLRVAVVFNDLAVCEPASSNRNNEPAPRIGSGFSPAGDKYGGIGLQSEPHQEHED